MQDGVISVFLCKTHLIFFVSLFALYVTVLCCFVQICPPRMGRGRPPARCRWPMACRFSRTAPVAFRGKGFKHRLCLNWTALIQTWGFLTTSFFWPYNLCVTQLSSVMFSHSGWDCRSKVSQLLQYLCIHGGRHITRIRPGQEKWVVPDAHLFIFMKQFSFIFFFFFFSFFFSLFYYFCSGCLQYLICNLLFSVSHMWPWSTKAVISNTGIFVAIAKNTLYGSKLYIFSSCQKSLGY